jgi:hypothetical protein
MLLHICCGPCSTYVAKILSKSHEIVGYFYNPNIFPYKEWLLRYEAFKKVVAMPSTSSGNNLLPERSEAKSKGYRYFVDFYPKKALTKEGWEMDHQKFLNAARGFENEPEGGARCAVCFKLRLEEAARFAKDLKENIFATTLTVGKNKKAEVINPIGKECGKNCGLRFYEADFKRNPPLSPFNKGGLGGFLESVKLSKEFGLYRQHYCGCEFSL